MEMVRDQSSFATSGWTDFQSKPSPKHIVEKAIAELPKKQLPVNFFVTPQNCPLLQIFHMHGIFFYFLCNTAVGRGPGTFLCS